MNLFHSLLLVIGEITLGLSVLVFVGAALAAYGEKFRSNRRRARCSRVATQPGRELQRRDHPRCEGLTAPAVSQDDTRFFRQGSSWSSLSWSSRASAVLPRSVGPSSKKENGVVKIPAVFVSLRRKDSIKRPSVCIMASSRNAALSQRGLVFSVCLVAGDVRRVEPVSPWIRVGERGYPGTRLSGNRAGVELRETNRS
jgi:hypothetical protein